MGPSLPRELIFISNSDDDLPSSPAPIRKIRIGGSRLLQIKGARSFRVKKGGSLSSIRRAGSLKSTKLSRQDSESENEEGLQSQTHSRDTVTDIGKTLWPQFDRLEMREFLSAVLFSVLAGSPFSTSEPSIEPEGPSSGGAEDNYHRNMSWLHVGPSTCRTWCIYAHSDFLPTS